MHQLFDEFKDIVDFLVVYIIEAHAQDEWPISSTRYSVDGQPIIYNQPTTQVQRCSIASDFRRDYNLKIPIVMDPMTNEFENLFCAWPIRFYICQQGVLKLKAMPEECTYDLEKIRNWLLQYQSSLKQ